MTATAKITEARVRPTLARMGWPLMFRAFVAILFAVCAFYWLGKSLPNLVMLFAAWCVADGVLALYQAVQGGGVEARNKLALAGGVSLVAAGVAAFWPNMTYPSLAVIVGVWAIVRGLVEFWSALTLRKYMERDWSLSATGLYSVLFGALFVVSQGFDPAMFVRLVSGYALILGLLMIVLGMRFLRGFRA